MEDASSGDSHDALFRARSLSIAADVVLVVAIYAFNAVAARYLLGSVYAVWIVLFAVTIANFAFFVAGIARSARSWIWLVALTAVIVSNIVALNTNDERYAGDIAVPVLLIGSALAGALSGLIVRFVRRSNS